jgi:Tol biopolymer transport system component
MEPPPRRRIGMVVAVALAAYLAAALGSQDDSTRSRDAVDSHVSPDGGSVLFARLGAIWRVPFSGGDPQRVTTAELLSGRPRWSPDGKQIAFLRRESPAANQAQIFIMPAGGGAAHAVSPASIDVLAFEWSPSSRRIAFVSGPITNPGGLWVMDANGSGPRMLSAGASTPFASSFAWAPDDSAIVRITGERAGPPPAPLRAEIIAVEGTTAPRVIDRDVYPSVSWSRDGTIALIGHRRPGSNAPNRLLVAAAPGFAIREVLVAADSNLAHVAWLGDGQVSLTFMSNQGSWIERLTLATGERVTVMPPGIAELFLTPSWSLDGTRFAVSAKNRPDPAEVYAGAISQPARQLTFSDR